MTLLARNEEMNKWLAENPAVLGGGAMAIGVVLLGIGIVALMTGKSTSKHGHKLEGPMAYLHGAIMAGFGALCTLFGLYKLATAVL